MDKKKTFADRMRILHEAAVRGGCTMPFEEFIKPLSEEEEAQKREQALEKAKASGKTIITDELLESAKQVEQELFSLDN